MVTAFQWPLNCSIGNVLLMHAHHWGTVPWPPERTLLINTWLRLSVFNSNGIFDSGIAPFNTSHAKGQLSIEWLVASCTYIWCHLGLCEHVMYTWWFKFAWSSCLSVVLFPVKVSRMDMYAPSPFHTLHHTRWIYQAPLFFCEWSMGYLCLSTLKDMTVLQENRREGEYPTN